MNREVCFFVGGLPITQGSMVATGSGKMRHSNPELEAWRDKVGWLGLHSRPYGWPRIIDGEIPFAIELEFHLVRPKSLPKRVLYPVKKRDIDKLLRAVMDGLTGVMWRDDGQVIDATVRKRFSDVPGVNVTVTQI